VTWCLPLLVATYHIKVYQKYFVYFDRLLGRMLPSKRLNFMHSLYGQKTCFADERRSCRFGTECAWV